MPPPKYPPPPKPSDLTQISPSGLTKAKFLQMQEKNPKLKNATWESVVAWQKKTRAARQTKRVGEAATNQALAAQQFGAGYLQTPPAQLRADALSLYPVNHAYDPLTNTQLHNQAQQMVDPIFDAQIKNITDMITRRSAAGTQAIQGYTNAYAQRLPAIQNQVTAAYNTAEQQQGQVNDALSNFIRNSGSQMSSDLNTQALAAGQSTAGAATVADTTAGASGATAATGASTLSRLIGQGAGDIANAASWTPSAYFQGGQTLGNFQGQLNQTLNDQTGALEAQLPQTLSDTYQSLLSRELAKGQGRDARTAAIADFYNAGLNRNYQGAIAGGALAQNAAQFAATQAQNQGQFDVTAANQAGQFGQTLDYNYAGLNADPNNPANQTWAQKFTNIKIGDAVGLAAIAAKLHDVPRLGSGLPVPGAQLPSYGTIRKQLMAIARGSLGNVPAAVLANFVNQALYSIGWTGPQKPGSKPTSPYISGAPAAGKAIGQRGAAPPPAPKVKGSQPNPVRGSGALPTR